MKPKKGLQGAVLIVVILSALSMWLFKKNSKSTLDKEGFDFAIDDTASITRINLVGHSGKQINLVKDEAGRWMVNKTFTPRPEAITNLLVCLHDLQLKQPVSKSMSDSLSKQLTNNALKVEIFKREELIKTYFVGTDTPEQTGTYMQRINPESGGATAFSPAIVYIPGFNGVLSVRYIADEDFWRSPLVYSFYPNQIASIKVENHQVKDSSFTIQLSDRNEISILDSKEQKLVSFDTLKAKRYITYYTNIRFEANKNDLPQAYKNSIVQQGAVYTITLTDRESISHVVKTFTKPADKGQSDPVTGKPLSKDLEHMYALINSDKDFVLIQYYVFGKLFQPLSYFKPSPVSEVVKK